MFEIRSKNGTNREAPFRKQKKKTGSDFLHVKVFQIYKFPLFFLNMMAIWGIKKNQGKNPGSFSVNVFLGKTYPRFHHSGVLHVPSDRPVLDQGVGSWQFGSTCWYGQWTCPHPNFLVGPQKKMPETKGWKSTWTPKKKTEVCLFGVWLYPIGSCCFQHPTYWVSRSQHRNFGSPQGILKRGKRTSKSRRNHTIPTIPGCFRELPTKFHDNWIFNVHPPKKIRAPMCFCWFLMVFEY